MTTKKQAPAIATRAEMEDAVLSIVNASIALDKLTNTMDGKIAAIRDNYAGALAEHKQVIACALEAAEEWARTHLDEFPEGRKSIEMTHGVIGFRTGTPKLRLLARETWDKVKARLLNRGLDYTRTTVEVDKEKLIGDREKLGDALLRDYGIKVVQDESFYVEPKREGV